MNMPKQKTRHIGSYLIDYKKHVQYFFKIKIFDSNESKDNISKFKSSYFLSNVSFIFLSSLFKLTTYIPEGRSDTSIVLSLGDNE